MNQTGRSEQLTVPQVAALLGQKVRWVREQVYLRRIPFTKRSPGRPGRLLFDRDEIDAWWAAKKREPVSELEIRLRAAALARKAQE